MPDSLLGLWASLTLVAVIVAAAAYAALFLWDFLYLGGGHW